MRIFGSILLGLLSTLSSSVSWACDVESALEQWEPRNRTAYPSNGKLYFDVSGRHDLAGIAVEVDASPAVLVQDNDTKFGLLMTHIEPPPVEAARVTIRGTVCSGSSCEVNEQFTIETADSSAPSAPTDTWFNVHDFADYVDDGASCYSSADIAIWSHADLSQTGETYGLVVEVDLLASDQTTVLASRTILTSTSSIAEPFYLTVADLKNEAAEDVCVRFTVGDSAGNKTTDSTRCSPRYLQRDFGEPSEENDARPSEPSWTNDALYSPPTEMNPSADGSVSSDNSVSGCGFVSSGPTSGPTLLMLAIVLGPFLRSRNRRS